MKFRPISCLVSAAMTALVLTGHVSADTFYVVDSPFSGKIDRFNSDGTGGFWVDSGLIGSSNSSVFGMALGPDGSLYVAGSGGTIEKIDPNGNISPFAVGQAVLGPMTVDSNGNVYVGSGKNNVGSIQKFSRDGVSLTQYNTGSLPNGLAVDQAGNLYVGLSSKEIVKYTAAGVSSNFGVVLVTPPLALACDAQGNVYVAHGSGVDKFTPNGTRTTYVRFGLSSPAGMAFDSSGTLYVVAQGANAVDKVTSDGQITSFVSGLASPGAIAIQPTPPSTDTPTLPEWALLLLGLSLAAVAAHQLTWDTKTRA